MQKAEQVVQKQKSNGQVNFPNLETREQKLDRKRKMREQFYQERKDLGFVLANISVNHQDYGMSPAEHLRAKAERLKNIS